MASIPEHPDCTLSEAMAAILLEAASEAVLPRFQRLTAREVEEKSPGELVTIADREAERIIARGLAPLYPDARFVGEEICAQDPSLLENLDEGAVWIVDPIDGTGNYAAGRTPFALMAALLVDGEILASAILDPVAGRVARAERVAGAFLDGQRLTATVTAPDIGALKGIVSGFARPRDMEDRVTALTDRVAEVAPTKRCAGHEYPLVATGAFDFALYWRTLVWDHAAGVLLLRESGGVAAHIDGTPYHPGRSGGGLLIARNQAIWNAVAAVLRQ
ncbi:inositol monophosphatase family protein [Qipengyuania sp.]|uniref:inositol monophosphatase family protein n=1 Tax=Qipengyuania sp. TaxID=2004515 RepID=UPI0035C8638B